jgi:nucleotide-binding universal stress UspA family protein
MDLRNSDHKTDIILVPLDTPVQSRAALPVAHAMAKLMNATLHILHVTPQPMTLDALRGHLALSAAELAGCVLDQVQGDAADGIMRTALEHKVLLIVMAMRHRDARTDSGLGSVAEVLLRRAPCPVLLVPPTPEPEPWRLGQMLLPQDGTPATAAVMESVCHLAHHAHATLLVVHVSEQTVIPRPGALHVPRYMDQPQHEWPVWTGEFLGRVRGLAHLPRDVELRMFLARGEAGSEILRLARAHGVDVIAMPWHGNIADAPVIKTVLRAAPCPVLILPFELPPQRQHPRERAEVHA